MTIAELFVSFGVKTDTSSVRNAESALARLYQGVRRLVLLRGFDGLARGVLGFAQRTAEAAVETNKMAQSLGMSVEQVQQWDFVAQTAGSTMKQLAVGVSFFEGNLRRLARGQASKQLRQDLAQLGIVGQDTANKILKSPAALQAELLRVSDLAQKMGDTPMRSALFRQTFGARAGRAFLSDISRGSKGLQGLFNKRSSFGLFDQKNIEDLRNFNVELNTAKVEFLQMGRNVIAELAPALTEVLKKTETWIGSHRELISGALKFAVEALVKAFELLAHTLDAIIDTIEFFRRHIVLTTVAVGLLAFAFRQTLKAAALDAIMMIIKPLRSIAIFVYADLIPALIDLTGTMGGVAAASAGVGASILLWLGPIAVGLAALYGVYRLIQEIRDEGDTSHERALEDSANAARDYRRAHPEDPGMKKMPRRGTKEQQDAFDRDVGSLEGSGSPDAHVGPTGVTKGGKAYVGGRGGATNNSNNTTKNVNVTNNVTNNISGATNPQQVAGAMHRSNDELVRRQTAAALKGGR